MRRFSQVIGFDLVLIETAGTGQGDTEIADLVDVSVYVMTTDYGGPSQLEKIQMLDYADLIALNKCDARESEDALRDVRKQWRRNRNAFTLPDAQVPVYPTVATRSVIRVSRICFMRFASSSNAFDPGIASRGRHP